MHCDLTNHTIQFRGGVRIEIECTFPDDLEALRSLLLSSLLSSSSATRAAALPLLRSLIYGTVWIRMVWYGR